MSSQADSISVIISAEDLESDSESLTSNSFIGKLLSTESFSRSSSDEFSNKVSASVIVKSTCQDYTGMLAGMVDCEKCGDSLAITTAKASLVEQRRKEEVYSNNTFAVPGRFYCKTCEQVILSVIKYIPAEVSFWKSVMKVIRQSRCCAENSETCDIVHGCPICQNVLIRITEV